MEDWAAKLAQALQDGNLAWIYPFFSASMREAAFKTPADFENWMLSEGSKDLTPILVLNLTLTPTLKDTKLVR